MTTPFDVVWAYRCGGPVIAVAATPNCGLIAAASVDRKAYLLDNDGNPLWTTQELDYEAWAIDISAGGQAIAVGTANKNPSEGSIYVFNRDGQLKWHWGAGAPVWSVSLSRDGHWLAASTWKNVLYIFSLTKVGYRLTRQIRSGEAGIYGVSLSLDGNLCVANVYGQGLLVHKRKKAFTSLISIPVGLYGVKLARDRNSAVVGRADGGFSLIEDGAKTTSGQAPAMSARPICGIAISDDGQIVSLGSFDGSLYLASSDGRQLWRYQTDGEVWSTAMSSDGSLVVAGSGDHQVTLLRNHCSSSAWKEIQAKEDTLAKAPVDDIGTVVEDIRASYLRTGLAAYGSARLAELLEQTTARSHVGAQVEKLLFDHLSTEPGDLQAHFKLGSLLKESGAFEKAIYHLQEAGREPTLQLAALTAAGDCFIALGYKTAAVACFQRAREPHLDPDRKRVLFNLARSYEDNGYWEEAASTYEVLLSWDSRYRNAWVRYEGVVGRVSAKGPRIDDSRVDYTGMTVSLLGPEVPRDNEVDSSLLPVLVARSEQELGIKQVERDQLNEALILFGNVVTPVTTRHDSLDYDALQYIKYDHPLPEDELKKNLELVHLLSRTKPAIGQTSLDIGTATGRYPNIFAQLGYEAYGIDIRDAGFKYAVDKQKAQPGKVHLQVGNAESLPYDNGQFNLITCMMGTFAHFDPLKRSKIFGEARRVLAKDGSFIISTWDIECSHITYLSIYSQDEIEQIRANSLSLADLKSSLMEQGFSTIDTVAFSLLPDQLYYQLQRVDASPSSMRKTIELELAVRSMFSTIRGQMFMVETR